MDTFKSLVNEGNELNNRHIIRSSNLTEKEYLDGLVRGDESVFRDFVNAYADRVYNTALGFLRNEIEAEDISQEVFIEVFQSIGSFRAESKLSTWLYKITVRKCLDLIKKNSRKKRKGIMLRLFTNQEGESSIDVPDFNHPGISLEQKELAAILKFAVDSLPEQQKIAFTLSKIEGLSQNEIAQIMNNSEGAVESLLSRAKQNLRQKLKTTKFIYDDAR